MEKQKISFYLADGRQGTNGTVVYENDAFTRIETTEWDKVADLMNSRFAGDMSLASVRVWISSDIIDAMNSVDGLPNSLFRHSFDPNARYKNFADISRSSLMSVSIIGQRMVRGDGGKVCGFVWGPWSTSSLRITPDALWQEIIAAAEELRIGEACADRTVEVGEEKIIVWECDRVIVRSRLSAGEMKNIFPAFPAFTECLEGGSEYEVFRKAG